MFLLCGLFALMLEVRQQGLLYASLQLIEHGRPFSFQF
jgi:hypothetical protein